MMASIGVKNLGKLPVDAKMMSSLKRAFVQLKTYMVK